MVALAFYRGAGRIDDRLIRWVTQSKFSHVEFLPVGPEGRAISASGRDGGVRWADINFERDRWQILEVPWAPIDAQERIEGQIGAKYDLFGLLGSQIFNLRRHSPGRWFCSELCAHALGLESPQELSPGGLYRRVSEMNRAYYLGISQAGEPPEE